MKSQDVQIGMQVQVNEGYGEPHLRGWPALCNREFDRRLVELGPEEGQELEWMLRIVAEGMRL
jgi:hypothetical protein